jgi:hypothetical protein
MPADVDYDVRRSQFTAAYDLRLHDECMLDNQYYSTQLGIDSYG